MSELLNIMYIEGWVAGMYRKGTRVRKINSVREDAHKNGAEARVLSALRHPKQKEGGYFVIWDDSPNIPCFVGESRLERVDGKNLEGR